MSGAHRARFAPRRGQRDARRAATAAAGEMRGSGPERCRRHISRSVLSPRPPPTAGLGCCVHAPHKIFGLFKLLAPTAFQHLLAELLHAQNVRFVPLT